MEVEFIFRIRYTPSLVGRLSYDGVSVANQTTRSANLPTNGIDLGATKRIQVFVSFGS